MSNQPRSSGSPSPSVREHDRIGADAPLYGCLIAIGAVVAVTGFLTWMVLA